MIRIIRGPRARLLRHPAIATPPAPALRVETDPDFPVPWGGARLLLALLRRERGDAVVDAAVLPHRALLSLALRGLEPALTPAERARREEARAQALGFLSHNGMIAHPLIEAWTGALAALTAGRGLTLVFPDAATLDPETVALARSLLRRLPREERPALVLGFDEARGPLDPLLRRAVVEVSAQLAAMEALPETTLERLDDPAPAPEPAPGAAPAAAPGEGPPPDRPLDPLDDDLERRAHRALAAAPGAPGGAASELALRALREAFGCFGYGAVLRLGLAWLERGAPADPALAAEVHTLVGLAAYNRQVQSGGNVALAEFLGRHFDAALALETDPGRRSHLLYRLCINSGRRRGDLEPALALAERAVKEARAPGLPGGLAAFLEAWARNGRAYVLARLGRLGDALADCEAAYALLERAGALPGAPAAELLPSRRVLADNAARVAEMARDLPLAARWQRTLEEIEDAMPGMVRTAHHRWLALHRAGRALRAALRRAEAGLDESRRRLDALGEDLFLAEQGDLLYRLGDALGALESFAGSLRIRRRVGAPEDVARTEVAAALAAARAGRLEEAEAGLEGAREGPACARPAAQGEVLAAIALLAARRGEGARADALANAAIEAAVESGERDALLRVARGAGEACLALGRREEARAAFERALEIAGEGEGPANGETQAEGAGAPPPPAAEVLAALLGLEEAAAAAGAAPGAGGAVPGTDAGAGAGPVPGAAEPASGTEAGVGAEAGADPARRGRLLRALALAERALEDADAWWDLPRLVAALIPLAEAGALEAPSRRAQARQLCDAAEEREDARAAAARLRAALG